MTGNRIPVLTAVEGAYEADLVTGLERSNTPIRVARRCADLAEVLACAAAGLGRAVVVGAELAGLDREAVWSLRSAGIVVVALAVEPHGHGPQRLTEWGVDQVLASRAAPAEVAAAVLSAIQRAGGATGVDGGGSGADGGLPGNDPLPAADPIDAELAGLLRQAASTTTRRGRVITVWGPAGAPGRTTIAINLAAELAGAGEAVLVDADSYGASVAQQLALLDESSGLAAAARAANAGALEPAQLAALCPVVKPGLRVLTGLPVPGRWPELRRSGLTEVFTRLRELADWTVIDVSFCLEADEELSFDTAAPQRNAATLAAIEAADLVLAVGSGDPVGLQRLIRGLRELREQCGTGSGSGTGDGSGGGGVPVRVVVNRVRASAVGDHPGERVREALQRFAGVPDPVLVPDDPAGCDACLLAGQTWAEGAPDSPARAALSALAAELGGVTAPVRRRRWPLRIRT